MSSDLTTKTILIEEGHEKVRWLLKLAQRHRDVAEGVALLKQRHKDVAEDVALLPKSFPKIQLQAELADMLGASETEFCNWFPQPNRERKNSESDNRPRIEVLRNVARVFGFAPVSDDHLAWTEWWESSWSSFLPSEKMGGGSQPNSSADEFQEAISSIPRKRRDYIYEANLFFDARRPSRAE